MIINKEVMVKITNRNINYYILKGYDVKNKKELLAKIEDLPICSTHRIETKCDICGKIKNISYQKYNENILNGGYYACSQLCSKEKVKKTNNIKYGSDYPLQSKEKYEQLKQYFIEKYGVDNTSKLEENKKKREKTMYERFGVKVNFILPETHKKAIDSSIKSKILSGFIRSYDEQTDFYQYKNKVWSITRKNQKELFEMWNGYDFYDKEHIIKNFLLKPSDGYYPTIDHKISIFYGYENNLDPFDIGDISNLCITKRYINSKKNKKNDFSL